MISSPVHQIGFATTNRFARRLGAALIIVALIPSAVPAESTHRNPEPAIPWSAPPPPAEPIAVAMRSSIDQAGFL